MRPVHPIEHEGDATRAEKCGHQDDQRGVDVPPDFPRLFPWEDNFYQVIHDFAALG